jgi:hypothetical protein
MVRTAHYVALLAAKPEDHLQEEGKGYPHLDRIASDLSGDVIRSIYSRSG